MHKLFSILFFVVCMAATSQAQDNNTVEVDTVGAEEKIFEEKQAGTYEDDSEVYVADTTLAARNIIIPEDTINSFKKNEAFAYVKNLDSLLAASQKDQPSYATNERVYNSGSFMSRLLNGPVIKVILWSLALIFVGIIVYQVLVSRGVFQRTGRSKVAEKPVEEEELLSLQNDFDPLIRKAYEQGDYRLAVRYHFLKTLQELKEKGHISYEPDKTNSRYVYEIPINWRNDFSRLIFQYEYVWYGHFDIDENGYERVQKGFDSFLQKV